MSLESGRNLVRGVLLLLFAAGAYWVDLDLGLLLVALMGAMILQSAFSDWCPADLFLRPLGLRKADKR